MLLYAKEINPNGLCMVGLGNDTEEYIKCGYTEQDVTFNKFDGNYYLTSKSI